MAYTDKGQNHWKFRKKCHVLFKWPLKVELLLAAVIPNISVAEH